MGYFGEGAYGVHAAPDLFRQTTFDLTLGGALPPDPGPSTLSPMSIASDLERRNLVCSADGKPRLHFEGAEPGPEEESNQEAWRHRPFTDYVTDELVRRYGPNMSFREIAG